MNDYLNLVSKFTNLKAWSSAHQFSKEDWSAYTKVARVIQKTDTEIVKRALSYFMGNFSEFDSEGGVEPESKLFILMRIVFDIPQNVLADNYRSYKGWINWPEVKGGDLLNLGWPVFWQDGKPSLIALYNGSQGLPYAAVEEYNYFLNHYAFRVLE
ncbi:hypothetical protein MHTCC0001_20030 [Flavobacteriaceae bacterium MHTCC 0001]